MIHTFTQFECVPKKQIQRYIQGGLKQLIFRQIYSIIVLDINENICRNIASEYI
jgi:hypothetical protein